MHGNLNGFQFPTHLCLCNVFWQRLAGSRDQEVSPPPLGPVSFPITVQLTSDPLPASNMAGDATHEELLLAASSWFSLTSSARVGAMMHCRGTPLYGAVHSKSKE